MRTVVPKYYFDLTAASQEEAEKNAEKITNQLLKENLSYKEAITALELAQDKLKEHKII